MAPAAPRVVVRHAFALLNEGGVGGSDNRDRRLAVCSYITWRAVTSTDDLSERDIRAIITTLEYWKHCGKLEYRCRRIADTIQEVTAK